MAAFVMFSSCGGNTGSNVAQEDSLVIDTVATLEQDTAEDVQTQLTETLQSGDAAQVQAAIEKVASEVKAAIESGDQQAAEKYASQIKVFVEQNADKLKALDVNTLTVGNLIDAAKNLPANARQTARDGKNAVKADANAAREAADAAAEKAKADAKAAADQAVEDAKEKASEKVDEAAAKASEKADQAIQDATDKAKKKLGL